VLPLTVGTHGADIPVHDLAGGVINVPRPQFRCLLEIPGFLLPRDAVIDTGAPLIIFPAAIWGRFHPGVDYEVLPFAGPHPPPGRVGGWQFHFQIARFLAPITLMDTGLSVRVPRSGVMAAFAAGDPPAPPGRKALPPVIVGLWGGVLEDGRIAVSRTPAGTVSGELQYP
jgi:hypothetical protein